MKLKNFLPIALFILLAISTKLSFGQTTIVSNSFEGADTWTISSGSPSVNSDAGSSDFPSNSRIKTGTQSWTINNSTETTEFSSQSIIGKVDVKVLIHLSSTAGTSGNGNDGSDYIKVWTNIDGAGFPINADIEISGNNNAKWDYSALLKASTSAGVDILKSAPQGGTNSNNYATLEITIPNGSNSISLKIEGKNNNDNEFWNIDDVTLVGENASTDPTISFDTASSSELETDVTFNTAIPVTMSNYTVPVSVNITVNGTSTANSNDYVLNTSSINFTTDGTQNISLDIKDDADADSETIILDITITSGTAVLGINQHTITITDNDLPNIIINEILADPTGIDANLDGNISTTEDEFVELVNLDTYSHDLTGYTISDGAGVKHIFGTVILPAGGSVVIFAGGTIPFANIPGISDKASSNTLAFNNSGDTVTLQNASNTTIASFTYGGEGGDDQSIVRNPDLTGVFVKHTTIISNSITASPGRYNVSNIPFTTMAWKGTTDNDWTTDSNWSSGTKPIATDDVLILNVANQPTTSGPTTVNSVTMDSGSSILTPFSFSGTVTYNRTLETTNWYLISTPVSGQSIANFYANESPALGSGTGNNQNVAIAPYDNTQVLNTERWDYYTEGQVDGEDGDDITDTFTSGVGYSVKMQSKGNIAFTGSINSGDVQFNLIQGAGNNFNFIGNPYAAYIDSSVFLTEEGITTTDITSGTLWVWNQANVSYEAKIAGDLFKVAPGQGFFVEANSTNTVTFKQTMQRHEASETFQRSVRPEVHLYVSDGTNNRFLKIYYTNDATKGYDNGYDGELFTGVLQSFAIYSNLVTDNDGKNYQIQSLPNSDFETTIIPLGINASSNLELIISAKHLNLPTGVNVIIEDKETNIFTDLSDPNSIYTFTTTMNLTGTGRFYLHTKSSILNLESNTLSNINIFNSDENTLKITGLKETKNTFRIFNLLGKQIINNSFETSNGKKEIMLPKLSAGIYIIQIENENGKLSKKIILN
jgi:hypothetical protein